MMRGKRRFLMLVGGIIVTIGVSGCCPKLLGAAMSPTPRHITGEELLNLAQSTFQLKVGESLFITTAEYLLYPVEVFIRTYHSIANIPSCRFKAAVLVVGMFHAKIDSYVAAGIAMGRPGVSPAWFVVIVGLDRSFYGLDPVSGRTWVLQPQDVTLLII